MEKKQEIERELDALECCAHDYESYISGAISALMWVLGRTAPVSEEFDYEI